MATSAFSWTATTTNKGGVNAFLKYKHIYTNFLVFKIMLGEGCPSYTWHEEKKVWLIGNVTKGGKDKVQILEARIEERSLGNRK